MSLCNGTFHDTTSPLDRKKEVKIVLLTFREQVLSLCSQRKEHSCLCCLFSCLCQASTVCKSAFIHINPLNQWKFNLLCRSDMGYLVLLVKWILISLLQFGLHVLNITLNQLNLTLYPHTYLPLVLVCLSNIRVITFLYMLSLQFHSFFTTCTWNLQ